MMSKQTFVLAIRAQLLSKTLGFRVAAGFLRNRGVTLEDALAILCPGSKGAALSAL